MADLASTAARSDSLRASDRITDAGYFGGMTSQQLDRAAAPLGLIAKSGEMSVYGKDLSLTAKRNFLTRFWTARDPSGEFKLALEEAGGFTWSFREKDKPVSVRGAYVVSGDNLVMQPDSGGTMLSTIKLQDDKTLLFTPIGNARPLTFTR